jgi:acyl-CoA thioesterase FadM
VTRSISATFHRPVRAATPYRVHGFLDSRDERTLRARAELVDQMGRRRAEARSELAVLSARSSRLAIGDLAGEDRRFVRE